MLRSAAQVRRLTNPCRPTGRPITVIPLKQSQTRRKMAPSGRVSGSIGVGGVGRGRSSQPANERRRRRGRRRGRRRTGRRQPARASSWVQAGPASSGLAARHHPRPSSAGAEVGPAGPVSSWPAPRHHPPQSSVGQAEPASSGPATRQPAPSSAWAGASPPPAAVGGGGGGPGGACIEQAGAPGAGPVPRQPRPSAMTGRSGSGANRLPRTQARAGTQTHSCHAPAWACRACRGPPVRAVPAWACRACRGPPVKALPVRPAGRTLLSS